MIDLTQTQEFRGKNLLPAGEYRAVIENAEPTKSKAGSPMVKVTFDIDGTKIYDYLVLDPKSPRSYHLGLSKAKSILIAIGQKVLSYRNEMDLADALVGEIMLEVDIKNDEYMGEVREKNFIKKFSAVPAMTRPTRSAPRAAKDVRFDTDSIPF